MPTTASYDTSLNYFKGVPEHFNEDKDQIDAAPVYLLGLLLTSCKANSISVPNLDLAIRINSLKDPFSFSKPKLILPGTNLALAIRN